MALFYPGTASVARPEVCRRVDQRLKVVMIVKVQHLALYLGGLLKVSELSPPSETKAGVLSVVDEKHHITATSVRHGEQINAAAVAFTGFAAMSTTASSAAAYLRRCFMLFSSPCRLQFVRRFSEELR